MDWLFLFLCVPAVLMTLAWAWLWRTREWSGPSGLIAAGISSTNAAFGVALYLRFRFHPTPDNVPPWQDSLVLNTALLGLLAPIAMILGFVAKSKGAPWWLVGAIELASVPLFLIGCAAGISV